MPEIKILKPRGLFLAPGLAGISCRVAGTSWNPSVEERRRVQGFLQFLESRSALYRPFDNNLAHVIIQPAMEIRARITSEMERIKRPTICPESLVAMRAACSKFLERTWRSIGLEYRLENFLALSLGELRATIGLHIARLPVPTTSKSPGK
jgi:hypothetical protein